MPYTAPIPRTMKALTTNADKTASVKEIPVPEIADDEVLVQVIAVAQNPTDWKYVENVTNPDTICGVDWSGTVVKKGRAVAGLEVGDAVAGFTHGGNYKDRGAFAEYLKVPADLAWKVPPGTWSYEEAATAGCGLWTGIQALFHPTRLGLVEPPAKVSKPEWVIIYGGSGSVGQYAIQLAKIAGYKVVSTASQRNFELVKSLGADAVFDYKDPEAVKKIKAATQDSIHLGLDAISEPDTQEFTVQTFGPGPGQLVVILPPKDALLKLRPDIKIKHTLLYTCHGQEFFFFKHYPAAPADRAHMAGFLRKLPELVAAGKLRPNPLKVWPGGLEAIPEGFRYMKEGKVSGEKIVYRLK